MPPLDGKFGKPTTSDVELVKRTREKIINFTEELQKVKKLQGEFSYNVSNIVRNLVSLKPKGFTWEVDEPNFIGNDLTHERGWRMHITRTKKGKRPNRSYRLDIVAGKIILKKTFEEKPLRTWTSLKQFETTILKELTKK